MKRWVLILIVLCVSSVGHADERERPCQGMTFLDCLATFTPQKSDASNDFKIQYEFENVVRIRAFKGKRWFKTLTFAYWLGGAARAYRSHEDIKLPSPFPTENNATTSFGLTDTTKTKLLSRSIVVFPLNRHSKIDHLWALQVTSKGASITLVVNFEKFHLRKF